MINIIRILIACTMTLLIGSSLQAKEINQTAKASVSNGAKDKLDKKTKILQFIKLVQPKNSSSTNNKIVDAIMKYSEKYKVDEYLIASTAYVESEFNMKSKPCIGIMQLLRSTPRFYDPKKQYDPHSIDGNIAIGTIELSHHIRKIAARGSLPDRTTDKYALQRYNGSRSKVSYSLKVMRVRTRLESWTLDSLKQKLKKGPVWNP